MRRMYSEKELSVLVYQAVGQYIEAGAFDEITADAVDAYLVEHPVDITALEGLDISVGSLDADDLVTGAEIVEKMSGYEFDASIAHADVSIVYASVVKNGNKITFVIFGNVAPTEDITSGDINLGAFNIPTTIGAKLYPYTQSWMTNVLSATLIKAYYGSISGAMCDAFTLKVNNGRVVMKLMPSVDETLTTGNTYLFRYEATFLLSDNLAE